MSDYAALCNRFEERFLGTSGPDAYLERRLRGADLDYLGELFRIGLSPAQWTPQHNFANRLTTPLWFEDTIVGFRGLTWEVEDDRPKSVPWPRAAQQVAAPFGVNPLTSPTLMRLKFAVLVEGEIDALTLWACGIPGVASLMAQLHETQCGILANLIDCAVVWADQDQKGAGLTGAAKTIDRLEARGVHTVLTVSTIPGVKDANDLYRALGPEGVRQQVCNAVRRAA
jgi:DNA primase